jgi:hypothetical protein
MKLTFLAVIFGMVLVVAFSGCLGGTETTTDNANLTANSDSSQPTDEEARVLPEIPANNTGSPQASEETGSNSAAPSGRLADSETLVVPNLINETDSVEIGEMI